eukprot:COSAG03_NODE_2015_length_3211_cov_3.356041_1_plen_258_part_00
MGPTIVHFARAGGGRARTRAIQWLRQSSRDYHSENYTRETVPSPSRTAGRTPPPRTASAPPSPAARCCVGRRAAETCDHNHQQQRTQKLTRGWCRETPRKARRRRPVSKTRFLAAARKEGVKRHQVCRPQRNGHAFCQFPFRRKSHASLHGFSRSGCLGHPVLLRDACRPHLSDRVQCRASYRVVCRRAIPSPILLQQLRRHPPLRCAGGLLMGRAGLLRTCGGSTARYPYAAATPRGQATRTLQQRAVRASKPPFE